MPRVEEFLAELRDAGVKITGEAEICGCARRKVSWPAVLTDLARSGRKQGVRFTRAGLDGPSDARLQNILRGYAFSAAESQLFIENVLRT